jgi:DNA-directed RNA polymerase specialized sigma24 family protein
MRFFAGFTIEETASVMGVSSSTVEREWRYARAWLHGVLSAE